MTPGRRAERWAERHLRGRGYATVARNLRIGRDELDLIMLSPDRSTVVLVEVKSSSLGLVRAWGALDRGKRHRIARALRALERRDVLHGRLARVDALLVDTSGARPIFQHLEGRPLRPLPTGGTDDRRS